MSGVIAVLVVVGVLAAMIGDRLGHRFGKKRVRLFSLRPRHSAILATCVTGGFIALVLSPAALWSAGHFAPGAEPTIVRIPSAGQPVSKPERSPAAPLMAAKPAVPSADPRLNQLQRQLAVAEARIKTLQMAAARKPAVTAAARHDDALVARRGELLCAAQVPGNLSASQSQRLLRDVLAAVEQTTRRRGASAGLTIARQQVRDVTNHLQTIGAFTLRLYAGRTARAGDGVAVQLSVQPLPPASLADLQEQDRLGNAATTLGLEKAVAQVPAPEALRPLPDGAYVPWQSALKATDGATRWAWHQDPVAGGPLWLRLSPASDRP